jgi:hypothetical protein
MKNISEGSAKTLAEAVELGISRSLCQPVAMTEEIMLMEIKEFIRNKLAWAFLNYEGSKEVTEALYELEAKLGCKFDELEAKRVNQSLKSIIGDILGVKAGND